MADYHVDPEKLDEAIGTLERTLRIEIEQIAGGKQGNVAQLKAAYEGLKILNEIKGIV